MEFIPELKPKKKKPSTVSVITVSLIVIGLGIVITLIFRGWPTEMEADSDMVVGVPEVEQGVYHVSIPDEVKGIYWTIRTAGVSRADQLQQFIEESDLNTVVIDLKTDDGVLGIVPQDPELAEYIPDHEIWRDMDDHLEKLGQAGIYRIARVAVFRDAIMAGRHPELALRWPGGGIWEDKIGSRWVDPASEQVWEYNLRLAREAYARGFDEVQFDYIRFPSDGRTSAIIYPVWNKEAETMQSVIARFFEYIGTELHKDNIPVSVDLFGMTFWSNHDYNIGQRMLDAYPHVDYISPMVYPSHYPYNFEGWGDPNDIPYKIVNASLEEGTQLVQKELGLNHEDVAKKWRPWLQDFDLGAVYTADMIKAQIEATRDARGTGWIFWNARNVYEHPGYYNLGEYNRSEFVPSSDPVETEIINK